MLISPIHVNHELLCAIAIRTNGPDLLQVSAIPLGPDWAPTERFNMFDMKIKPQRTLHNLTREQHGGLARRDTSVFVQHGVDYHLAGDMFIDWFNDHKLAYDKRVVPVCYRWHTIQPYLRTWLRPENFDACFSKVVRDLYMVKNFVNDIYDCRLERIMFPKEGLGSMVRRLSIEEGNKRDSLIRARMTGEAYKQLLKIML